MSIPLVLASGSAIRAEMLRNAGVQFEVSVPRIDEETIKMSIQADETGASARDIADVLAEAKARKTALKHPEAMVIGCDQILAHGDQILSKPKNPDHALAQLKQLRGERHALLSAAVIYHEGQPIWRHVGQVRLRMREFSDAYLNGYVDRNWDQIQHCVGGYQLEAEGVRLFHNIEGDYFHVLGMPLLELLAFLTLRGAIEG